MFRLIFLRSIRLICAFPLLGIASHRLLSLCVSYAPFIKTLTRWHLISLHNWSDELARSRYRRRTDRSVQTPRYELDVQSHSVRQIISKAGPGGKFDMLDVRLGLLIEGRVVGQRETEVSLILDGRTIAKRRLKDCESRFRFWLKDDLILKLPKEGNLGVQLSDGKELYHAGHPSVYFSNPHGDGTLLSLVVQGVIVNKKGHISGNTDLALHARQDEYLLGYQELQQTFKEATGRELFLAYGTLLGCIREQSIIPHDDDFDVGFYSDATTPEAVRADLRGIIDAMERQGYLLLPNTLGRVNRIKRPDSDLVFNFDPFWFHKDTLVLYEGKRIRCQKRDLIPVVEERMAGHSVWVPRHAELILREFYGQDWRIPDPSYMSDRNSEDRLGKLLWLGTLFSPLEMKDMGYSISL